MVTCAGWNLAMGLATKRWPQVQGRFIPALVKEEDLGEQAHYSPQVEYEYVVEDTTFRGTRLRYGLSPFGGYLRRKPAEQMIAHYRVGSPVEVFFRPRNPKNAV